MGVFLAAAMALPLLGSAEGHPVRYDWTVTKPSSQILCSSQQNIMVELDQDGLYKISLDVLYLHESPFGPWPWVAHTSVAYSTVIFADDFESGNVNAWN